MTVHHVPATPSTVRWGIFDAAIPPVVTVQSGDTVVLECVSGGPQVMPPPGSGFAIPPALAAIHASDIPRAGGHIITGPVAVAGAMPGDMLEVRIDRIELGNDWGFCGFRPLAGTLPEDFHEPFLTHIPVDRAKMTCRMPYGVELKLAPFFGVMGVAPPKLWGPISSGPPREHGGNMDNKELIKGSTLFLPVHVDGGNFSAGDGHAAQGDGEVNSNGLETALGGTFEIILRKDLKLTMPRAETPTHYITMGMDVDLDDAAKQALREMIVFIVEKTNLSREDAYTLCSLAADLRVTQIVDGNKGIHVMLAKTALHGT